MIATAAMEQASIVACGAWGYGKFARRSCRFEPMPSLRDGSDLRDLSVWTISLFSAKPICVEFCRRTSPITIVGDRTARWGKQLHAVRRCLSGRKHVERSLRHLCSAGYTIFIELLPDKFLRPTAVNQYTLCLDARELLALDSGDHLEATRHKSRN